MPHFSRSCPDLAQIGFGVYDIGMRSSLPYLTCKDVVLLLIEPSSQWRIPSAWIYHPDWLSKRRVAGLHPLLHLGAMAAASDTCRET